MGKSADEWSQSVLNEIMNWMDYVPDHVNLNQMTIPGTHDSHATDMAFDDFGAKKPWTTTQFEWIPRQLQIGVRYLDLRVGNPNFKMRHGKSDLKDHLEDCLRWIEEFLRDHKRETVLVSIKWDADGEDVQGTPLHTYVRDKWTEKAWYAGTDWPTLGEVRGRAVLLRRFGLKDNDADQEPDPGFGINCDGFYGKAADSVWETVRKDGTAVKKEVGKWTQQDDGTKSGLAIENKWNTARDHLDYTRNQPIDDHCAHFIGLADNNPPSATPEDYSKELIPYLMRFLSSDSSTFKPAEKRYGIIVLDFMRLSQAVKILSKNWDQVVVEPGSGTWTPNDKIVDWPSQTGIKIRFHDDGNLVVWRHEQPVSLWASENRANGNPRLDFWGDNNFVVKDGEGQVVWSSETDTGNWNTQDCRLRFMSGPPFIMIDTGHDKSKGQIWWSTAGKDLVKTNPEQLSWLEEYARYQTFE